MKKTITKHEYDTNSATLIRKYTYGNYGDPHGYEESLYETDKGLFFLYVAGGEESPYPKENIIRISKSKTNQWMECH